MICRRCLRLFAAKDKVSVKRGASVHTDKKVCDTHLKEDRRRIK
jgi:hypothetical protein